MPYLNILSPLRNCPTTDMIPGRFCFVLDATKSDADLTFGVSQRGQRRLILQGYSFVIDRGFKDTNNWRCSGFRTYSCKARAVNTQNHCTSRFGRVSSNSTLLSKPTPTQLQVTYFVDGKEKLKSVGKNPHSHNSVPKRSGL